jgi:hypothetical protein
VNSLIIMYKSLLNANLITSHAQPIQEERKPRKDISDEEDVTYTSREESNIAFDETHNGHNRYLVALFFF